MKTEYNRILKSIESTKGLGQVKSTERWISLFKERFKADDMALDLRKRLIKQNVWY